MRTTTLLLLGIGLALVMPGVAEAQGPTTWNVATESELLTALSGAVAGDTIRFTANITLTANLPDVSTNLTIDGNNYTLNGAGFRGLSFDGGNITATLQNLVIQNATANGGNGISTSATSPLATGGGGGAGLGGALYIGPNANVTVSNVTLTANQAVGGAGGTGSAAFGNGGAGGNVNTGNTATPSGGGGAGGIGFSTPNPGTPGGFGQGGGGGGYWIGGTAGGTGGFGAGAGGSSDASVVAGGEFGGSNAGSFGGGGGAGIGGAVFVRAGGTLTIAGGFTVNGNSVTGGAGGTGATAGSALGSGIFLDGNAPTLNINSNSTVTISDVIADLTGSGGAGSAQLSKSGTGTLVLGGNNTYSGGTALSGGTLSVASNANLGAAGGVLSMSSSTTLQITGSDTFARTLNMGGGPSTISVAAGQTANWSGQVTEDAASTLQVTGGGTLWLAAGNSYTGGTSVGGNSALVITSDSALGDTLANAAVTLGDGTGSGLLGLNTTGFTSSRNFTLGAGGGLFDVFVGDATLGGVIGGAGSLTKSGGNVLTLTGNNTYTGATNVNGGVLRAGSATAFGTTGSLFVNTGATADLNGFAQSIFSISGAGTIALGTGALTVGGDNSNSTFAGAITGTGSLAKTGSGILTLSGANTFAGGLSLAAGTLRVSSDANLGGAGTVAMSNATTLDLTTGGTYAHALGVAGTSTVNTAAGQSVTWSGQINDNGVAGALRVTGGGTFTLTNTANSYSGGTVVAGGGTLNVGTDAVLGAAGTGVTLGDATTGGTLRLTTPGMVFSRAMTLGAAGGTIDPSTGSTTVSGAIGGTGALTKTGAGVLTLSGANVFAGGLSLQAGTVRVSSDANLGGGIVAMSDATTLDLPSGGAYSHALTVAGTSSLNAGAGQSVTWSGQIGGTGALQLTGGGTFDLTNTGNSYSGGTTVSGGSWLNFSSNAVLGAAGTAVTLGDTSSTGTLGITASSTISRQVTLGAAGGGIDTVSGATATVSGTIDGAGALTKSGAGILTLSGANTFASGLNLAAGTVRVSSDGNLGGSASVAMSDATTLDLTSGGTYAHALAVAGTSSVNVASGQSVTWTGRISDNGSAGTLQLTGGGVVALTNTGNSYSGGTIVSGSTTLNAGSDTVLGSAGTRLFLGNATTSGTLGLTTTGMVFTRPITLGAAGGAISTSSGTTATVSGAIGGTGGLTKSGAGTLILSGANTFAGGLTLQSGLLRMTSGTSLSSTATLSLGDGTTLDLAGGTYAQSLAIAGTASITSAAGQSVAWNGKIAGTGTLGLAGGGTFTLTNTSNSYSGGTLVTGGTTLVANSDSVLGASLSRLTLGNATTSGTLGITAPAPPGITFARPITLGGAGGVVDTAATSAVTMAGTISGVGGLTKTGLGTLSLTGLHAFTGLTHVHQGTLFIDAGLPGSILVDSGATLQAGGVIGGSLNVGGGTVIIPAPSLHSPTFNRTFFGANSTSGARTVGLVPSLVVNGDLTTSAGSTFKLWLSPDVAAPIVVNGTATFTDTHLVIDVNDPNPKRVTTYLGLAATGGLHATGGDVNSPSPLLVPVLKPSANALAVTVVNLGVPLPLSVPAAFNGANATGDFRRVMTELWALDDASVAAGVRQLSGEIHASVLHLAALDSAMMTDMVRNELSEQEPAAEERSAAKGAATIRPWFETSADHISYDPGGVSGGTGNVGGSGGGVDFKPVSNWTLGGGGSLSLGGLSLTELSATSTITAPRAFFYSGFTFGPFSVHFGGSRGWTTTTTDRDIEFAAYVPDPSGRPVPLTPGTAPSGAFTDRPADIGTDQAVTRPGIYRQAASLSRTTSSDAWSEWQFKRKIRTWNVDTKLGLRAARFSRENFDETGADSISLEALNQTLASNQTNFDFHAFRRSGTWRPNILVTYRREFGDEFTSADMSFAGNPGESFQVRGFPMPRDTFEGLFGLTMRSRGGLLYTLEYHMLRSTLESRSGVRFRVRLW